MAREASIAIGGYYPTPPHLLPRIAALFAFPKREETARSYEPDPQASFLDPCAGDGDAIFTLAALASTASTARDPDIFACELEASRYKALNARATKLSWSLAKCVLHGDAFRVQFTGTDGVSLLYLNPPYDTDKVHGRLEQRFLARFADALRPGGGVLVFVIPYHALTASAKLLATKFTNLHCFRFPPTDFDAYKQIVLVAVRREAPLFEPDPETLTQVQAWAADVSRCSDLPEPPATPIVNVLPAADNDMTWSMQEIDITALLQQYQPWSRTQAGRLTTLDGILPSIPAQDLLLRRYPVATPPRPAHIASGIAAGIFNGSRIEATGTALPPLLVKGVFDKEYRTVEEKRDAEGAVKGLVQIQQPKLVTTVLDLKTYRYHVLGSEETGSQDVAEMGIGDLLKHYGASLTSVMEQNCPIQYNPRRTDTHARLPDTLRAPFTAQAHATRAIVELLGGPYVRPKMRRQHAAILLGEIGSGKSTVALIAANMIDAHRVLIVCPPHLLQSWDNEITAVLPEARIAHLTSITDVDHLAATPQTGMTIALLSREAAKLGHAWTSVSHVCPRCGTPVPPGDLAKKRARCDAQRLVPTNEAAQLCIQLAHLLEPYAPHNAYIQQLLPNRTAIIRRAHYAQREPPPQFPGLPKNIFDTVFIDVLLNHSSKEALRPLLLAIDDEKRTAHIARALLVDTDAYSDTRVGRTIAADLPSALHDQIRSESRACNANSYYDPWRSADTRNNTPAEPQQTTLQAACAALATLVSLSTFQRSRQCNEFLFQAIPEPRRLSLARYITKKHPRLFDAIVLDECHELASEGSAQERAGHRLTALGLPTILMTGTIMNGYAESLFTNMWAVSQTFRTEFAHGDKQRFNDRYGYRKRIVEDRDKETGKIVAFGSMSDRVERRERIVGNAPGVLPLFLFRHLLRHSVTLHKSDLAIDLPPCTQERNSIVTPPELHKRYKTLLEALAVRIRADMFNAELAGTLFGQLAEMPSYLDRATADTGNTPEGRFEIRYPESVGGELIAVMEPFPASHILPKETWLLKTIEAELTAGRNCLVFGWHISLLPRLARLIEECTGEDAPILYASKVPPAQRQAWIDKEIIKKHRRILVTNPVAIQTGLNNLVHFSTELWLESPAVNPITYRQAIGRIDRIGQTRPTKIHFGVYDNTVQVALYDLLLKKVAVSVATDGLDPESALIAAGVGEDTYMTGLSIGKQIWALLNS